MVIRKSLLLKIGYAFLAVALLFLVGILLISLSYFTARKLPVTCTQFKDQYPPHYDCGYTTTATDNSFSTFIGKIQSTTLKNNQLRLDVLLKDSRGKQFTEPFFLPPDSIKVGIVLLTPLPKKPGQNFAAKGSGASYTNQEAILLLKKNDELQLIVDTPLPNDSSQKNPVMRPYAKCNEYNRHLVNYLKRSTVSSYLTLKLSHLFTSCSVTVFTITKFK